MLGTEDSVLDTLTCNNARVPEHEDDFRALFGVFSARPLCKRSLDELYLQQRSSKHD